MFPVGAIAGVVAAYGSMLTSMTPEARAAYFAEQARRRELERLEATPEVVLARERVARELARRRLELKP